ncbi:universal stress protein [Candidatus Nitrosotenuis chungbukensis]|uniref:universal stress protein n=1 Tax=Candidatus Nitrosotenuis chungbukensis TaxID=1353246 RepID=UPI0005B2E038|nr:universal stress protein [Candidatus Nitrosotenuis chungbukensis]WKT58009.1 universal stress protein [Candidatus Nitrosotenuis chungbukensis]
MNEKYRRILVPHDGSKFSKKALDEAIEMAKKFDSDLYLLTVMDALTVAPPTFYAIPGAIFDIKKFEKYYLAATSKTDLMLRNEVSRCKEQGTRADYEIMTGSPGDTILEFAKKKKIDLIVMGSQGLSGIHKIKALGSISRKVSELAACPVLIVR